MNRVREWEQRGAMPSSFNSFPAAGRIFMLNSR